MAESVLVARRIPEVGEAILRAAGYDVDIRELGRAMTAEELCAAAQGKAGLLTIVSDYITDELLAACPSVRAVANMAVGYNNIDVAACTRRGVGVSNTPGVLTDATAEVAFGLILAASRRFSDGERELRAGQWAGIAPLHCLGHGVCGKTLGIVGAGRIGTRVARMAGGFDMPIVYTSRQANAELDAMGGRRMALDELLRTADVVSIHVPLTSQTNHLIGARELALMKPTAVLVNTSRGPVIDEAALVEALRERRIFAAGLDVYEDEPQVAPGLLACPHVVALPHIGSATHETRGRMAEMAATNLVAMLQGRRPANPVNPELWAARG